MTNYSRSPQIMIALAAALAFVSTAPFVQAQIERARGDTFVVQIQNGELIEVNADRMLRQQSRFVSLKRGDKTVAVFGPYQVMYVVRKADYAANLYEVQAQDGSTARFRADDMRLDPQGFIELTVDGELSGVIGNQTRYVRLIEDDQEVR